jgi:hypothetical protein
MAESDSDISKESSPKKKVTKDFSSKKPTLNKGVFLMVFALLIASVSFYGGTVFEKDHSSSSPVSANSASGSQTGNGAIGGGYGRFGGGFSNHIFGQVSAISSSSISIQDNRTGTTITLAITSSTQITDNGQSVSVSDIQTGDTVIASKSTSNSSDASVILVNPSLGGSGSGNPQSNTGSSSVPNISTN